MAYPCQASLHILLLSSLYAAIAVAMEASPSSLASEVVWWHVSLPLVACLTFSPMASSLVMVLITVVLIVICTIIMCWTAPGGHAWGRLHRGRSRIPGPRGWPVIGSLLDMGGLAHVRLAQLASRCSALTLMAFSLGDTRVVLTCVPEIAREILNSSSFADRPIKQSARQLLFDRAIGFAPYGTYWRNLRRIAANHLFAPKRIAAHEPNRQHESTVLLEAVSAAMAENGGVRVRTFLQRASVNNIMSSVFGKTYSFGDGCEEAERLQGMIGEGFELLGAFNWGDHLQWFGTFFDTKHVARRCESLVAEVRVFVQKIIDEHWQTLAGQRNGSSGDFVDVLLSLDESEKLDDADMIAVLWEMIFRGTDTTAILMEWILAELVLHPAVQRRVQAEIDNVVSPNGTVTASDLVKLPYVQAVIKETLRMHPPGPLLSWARLAISDVHVAGHHVPTGTTAMVNIWAITHDPSIWSEPDMFKPERFLASYGGTDVDIKGNDPLVTPPSSSGQLACSTGSTGHPTLHNPSTSPKSLNYPVK